MRYGAASTGACEDGRGAGSAKATAKASREPLTIRRMTRDVILPLADFLVWVPRGRRRFFLLVNTKRNNKNETKWPHVLLDEDSWVVVPQTAKQGVLDEISSPIKGSPTFKYAAIFVFTQTT